MRSSTNPRTHRLALLAAVAVSLLPAAALARGRHRPRVAPAPAHAHAEPGGLLAPPEGVVGLVSRTQHEDRRGAYLETQSCTGFVVATWQGPQIATARHCIPHDDAPLTVYDARRAVPALHAVMPQDGPDVALVQTDAAGAFPAVQLADSHALRRGETLCAWRVRTDDARADIVWDRSCARFLGHRVIDTGTGPHEVILIEHALSPGFSGGPVMDAAGRVVGVGVATSEGFDVVEPVEHLEELASAPDADGMQGAQAAQGEALQVEAPPVAAPQGMAPQGDDAPEETGQEPYAPDEEQGW